MWAFGKKAKSDFAKIMAAACVQRGTLETLHDGKSPITFTGDYSDVMVIDAAGREIPWNEVSHINADEMKTLMSGVANRIYTFLLRTVFSRTTTDDNKFWRDLRINTMYLTSTWDEPQKIDDFLLLYPEIAKVIADKQRANRRPKESATLSVTAGAR